MGPWAMVGRKNETIAVLLKMRGKNILSAFYNFPEVSVYKYLVAFSIGEIFRCKNCKLYNFSLQLA